MALVSNIWRRAAGWQLIGTLRKLPAMPSRATRVLGWCLAAAVLLSCSAEEPADKATLQPNVILLTVDTLRADHLALYGYDRSTTPAVDRFAATATVFDNAIVPRGSTRPSYASMLTGLYPIHHGVRSNGRVLHESVVTLAETLRAAGYHTAGFVSNFMLLGEMSGLDQGFDLYDDRLNERSDKQPGARGNWPNYERTAAHTLAAILEWLASDPPEPFFLFVNFIDPHGPYRPPARYRELFQSEESYTLHPQQIPPYVRHGDERNFYDYIDRYDREIRLTDDAIAELIQTLQARNQWDESWVVFTADHGESLGEHQQFFEHHMHLWEETTRVPLVIRPPRSGAHARGASGRRVRSVASPMDLLPTIAAELGLKVGDLDGINLLPALAGDEQADRTLFIEFPDVATPSVSHINFFAVRNATHKLIRMQDQHTGASIDQAVFDIARDPLEQKELSYDESDPVHRELSRQLDAMLAEVKSFEFPFPIVEYEMPISERPAFIESRAPDSKRVRKELTPEQVEKLRALGYVK